MKRFYTSAVAALAMTASSMAVVPAVPDGFSPVTTLPDGAVALNYGKNGLSSTVEDSFGSVFIATDPIERRSCEIAFVLNQVYVMPMMEYMEESVYLVGTVEEGIVTFSFPQAFDRKNDTSSPVGYFDDYALLYSTTVDITEGFMPLPAGMTKQDVFTPAATQELKFKIMEDGSFVAEPGNKGLYLGLGYVDNDQWQYWKGGDIIETIVPQSDLTPEIPEDVEMQTWNYISELSNRRVEVGFGTDHVYLRGLCEKAPNAVMVGQILGSNFVFDSSQIIGLDNYGGLVYAAPVNIELVNLPGYGIVRRLDRLPGNITMAYDAEKNIINKVQDVAFTTTPTGEIHHLGWLEDFRIGKPTDAPIEVPAPYNVEFTMSDGEYTSELWFSLSYVYGDINLLDPSKLYFSIYFDGDLYAFEPDEFPSLPKAADEIPYGYDDTEVTPDYGFAFSNGMQGVIIRSEGFESIGVQGVYIDGDQTYRSEIVTVDVKKEEPEDPEDSINDINAASGSVEMFDLSGRKVSESAKGIVIMRSNGQVRKVVVK